MIHAIVFLCLDSIKKQVGFVESQNENIPLNSRYKSDYIIV